MSRRYLTFFIVLALALLVAILARQRSTSARPPAPAASRSATPTEGAGEPAADSSDRTAGAGIRNPERVVRTAKARVTAVVTTRGGDAVAGVRVQLVTEEDDADGKLTQEARTDKAGLAVFEPVPVPGNASLEAWDLDAGAGYASTSLKTEGDVRVEVELEPTMTVRGRVTEAATGAP
ncbi:MAG: hypothetical protein K8T20_08310, partial [Planctomycetes bacterium]|nr:hypothetical protein [Planctomycetota bacterium]